MDIYKNIGQKIRVLAIGNVERRGFVEGYTDSNNNPEEEESIDNRIGHSVYCFFPCDIKDIEILEK